jgi:hypothetical protein
MMEAVIEPTNALASGGRVFDPFSRTADERSAQVEAFILGPAMGIGGVACAASASTTSGTASHRSWSRRGRSLKEVQELLGHESIQVTMRYAHLAPERMRDAVAVLDSSPDKALDAGGHAND